MSIPDRHTAGDTLQFGVNVPDFLPADGWTLVYRLVLRTPLVAGATQDPIELSDSSGGTVDGTAYDYVLSASSAATASWAPGTYNWWRWVQKTGARQTLDARDSAGQLILLADPATATQGFDNRTPAQKAYDDACAALRDASARAATVGTGGSATSGLVEYQIGDRRFKYGNPQEAVAGLVALKNAAALDLKRERVAQAQAAGLPNPTHFYTRMGRV